MQQAVELLARTLNNQTLVTEMGRDVLSVIVGYAKTWRLLLQYDEDALVLPAGCQPARGVLEYDFARQAIFELKQELKGRGDATDLFGSERGDALAAILGNIEQTMFGDPLYRTREEKAAHLLYFVIKDHPFLDGNKRIGSFLFLLYNRQEGIPEIISENTLTALALLIAESEPANKDLMIRLIVNLLMGLRNRLGFSLHHEKKDEMDFVITYVKRYRVKSSLFTIDYQKKYLSLLGYVEMFVSVRKNSRSTGGLPGVAKVQIQSPINKQYCPAKDINVFLFMYRYLCFP